MAVDAFLKLWDKNGKLLVGETSDDNMNGAIQINDFSLDSQSLSRKKKKDTDKDKDKHKEKEEHTPASAAMFTLKVGKDMDQASPMLVQSYSVNSSRTRRSKGVQPFEKGVLFVRKPGAHNFIFLRLTFLGLYVIEYKVDVKEESSIPSESLSFGFRGLKLQYLPQLTTGGRGKQKFAGWNLRDNQRDDTQDV